MYTISNDFTRGAFTVMVVGCGGTGGYVAEGLCRVLPSKIPLVLVDYDRVEERNLTRQNFFKEEIGKFKSEALSLRLAKRYGRPVGYSVCPISRTPVKGPGLLIGCVDNGLARRDIALKIKQQPTFWWVDAGNGENYGQILIGNSTGGCFDANKEKCLALPYPSVQRPELLSQKPILRQLDCTDFAEQGPTINRVMAALVIEIVQRIILGTCPWMQLNLDLGLGTLSPVLAHPDEVKNVIGNKKVQIN